MFWKWNVYLSENCVSQPTHITHSNEVIKPKSTASGFLLSSSQSWMHSMQMIIISSKWKGKCRKLHPFWCWPCFNLITSFILVKYWNLIPIFSPVTQNCKQIAAKNVNLRKEKRMPTAQIPIDSYFYFAIDTWNAPKWTECYQCFSSLRIIFHLFVSSSISRFGWKERD